MTAEHFLFFNDEVVPAVELDLCSACRAGFGVSCHGWWL